MATKTSSLDAAVRSLASVIKNVGPSATDVVLKQLHTTERIISELTKATVGLSESDVGIVCDRVLALPDGTGSVIADVFTCKVIYEAVTGCTESGSLPSLPGQVFYENYLRSVVDRCWVLLNQSNWKVSHSARYKSIRRALVN